MPLLLFQRRGEMWAIGGRRWASPRRQGALGTVTILQSSGEARQKNRAALKVPANLFLRAAGLGEKWGFWEHDQAFNTPLEPTKQQHNHLHLLIKKKTWRIAALLDLFNWIIKLRWKFFCNKVAKALWPGQNNSKQSSRFTQDLSSLEKWGLISTS